MTPHFKVKNLVYGGFGPVSFDVSGGGCIGIFGESGCGKTRLLRALADLDPHQGEIALNDEKVHSLPAPRWRRKVAFLPAESQWWHDRVSLHFRVSPERKEFDSLGLSASILEAEVSHLSSGEKQRLALLRALRNSPSVLLLDEITSHLDTDRAELTERKIVDLKESGKVAVVWVSHNIGQLQRVCSSILFMEQGGMISREEKIS